MTNKTRVNIGRTSLLPLTLDLVVFRHFAMDTPRPTLQNPLEGTTIDTSPSTLHLHTEQDESSSTVVDRIVRKASQVKKSGHRKLHSLSKRGKGPKSDEGELQLRPAGHLD
jgi:hypothetical protein